MVTGCLAGICQENILESFPDVLLVPPSDRDGLDEIIGARVKLRDMPEIQDRDPLRPVFGAPIG